MKLNEITIADIEYYLNIEMPEDQIERDKEKELLTTILTTAKVFISEYTGIPMESDEEPTINDYDDFWMAAMTLCQDMYDNRAYQVEKNNVNKVASAILDMHRQNLL